MKNKNKQISEFLSYYYNLPSPPGYAVLIRASWGAGKTWFMKDSINKLEHSAGFGEAEKKERRALYVSLYGMSSTKDIESEFFRQLHPILGSKGMAIAGKVAKGMLKGTLKIDLDGDGKADGSISANVPDIELPKYLRNTEGLVLVFDDIERCSIPIGDLMGYINYYVEHDGYKAILVANEEELLRRDTEESRQGAEYRRIKEKLIGKTFEIESNVNDAIDAFLGELEPSFFTSFLQSKKELVANLHSASGYSNLRHLRQIFHDFTRIGQMLPEKARGHDDLCMDLLKAFVIFSIEIKSGSIAVSDIGKFAGFQFQQAIGKTSSEDDIFRKVLSKYPHFSPSDAVLSIELWQELLDTGLVGEDQFAEAMLHSKYFARDNAEEWRLLWDLYSLTDEEVASLAKIVQDKFINGQYKNVGILLHVCGILLELSSIGAIAESFDTVIDIAKKNIDSLDKSSEILESRSFLTLRTLTGWGGLGWRAPDNAQFGQLLSYAKDRIATAAENKYPADALELLNVMDKDTWSFSQDLTIHNGPSRYYDVPILSYIDPNLFVRRVAALHPRQLQYIPGTLKERYSSGHAQTKLRVEYRWLIQVARELGEEMERRKGKISGVLLGYVRQTVLTAAQTLHQGKSMIFCKTPRQRKLPNYKRTV
ncbi:P-loop NTPase fold protein [Burkholderia pyrrocinia]|uniref:P-loop NTPase fold protein n=1 Tax=Burkholderia pyrrocinia TaxID=60550 RepID=UPI0038B50A33